MLVTKEGTGVAVENGQAAIVRMSSASHRDAEKCVSSDCRAFGIFVVNNRYHVCAAHVSPMLSIAISEPWTGEFPFD